MKKFIFLLLCFNSFLINGQVSTWAKGMGHEVNYEACYGLAVDASGNSYVTGTFSGTVDFDPGPSIYNLSSNGSNDIFISKFDKQGNFIWAKKIGGSNDDWASSIAVDVYGDILITGSFQSTSDFDPGNGVFNLTSAGYYDLFLLKLNSYGNFIWAKRVGGGTSHEKGYGLTVDGSGSIYMTGFYGGIVDFDPGPGTYNLPTSGAEESFICKFDQAGNLMWAKNISGRAAEIGSSIALDSFGNVYCTGLFYGHTDFDTDGCALNITTSW